MKYNLFIFFLGIILLTSTCSSIDEKNYSLPNGYKYDDMAKYILPDQLNEVSGILWSHEYQFICIQDEKGRLYKVDIKAKKIIETSDFKKNMDFESVVLIDNKYYCLESNGDIYIVSNAFTKDVNKEKIEFPYKGKNDFETLISSPRENSIYILCKNCKKDEKNEASAFKLDLNSYQIEKSDRWNIKGNNLEKNSKLRIGPSAAAMHPLTGNIFIISHSGKWLAVFDNEEKLVSFHHLNPKIFNQPEGITFNSNGDLYISNEARGGSPDIVELKYRP